MVCVGGRENTGRRDSGEGKIQCKGSQSPLFSVQCLLISTAVLLVPTWPVRMEDGSYPRLTSKSSSLLFQGLVRGELCRVTLILPCLSAFNQAL